MIYDELRADGTDDEPMAIAEPDPSVARRLFVAALITIAVVLLVIAALARQ